MNLTKFELVEDDNFTFQPTFDGKQYQCVIKWNVFGQRYYINCLDDQNRLIYAQPLIASPSNRDINLNSGYFDTAMIFRGDSQNFEVY